MAPQRTRDSLAESADVSEALRLRLAGPAGEPVDLWRTLMSHGFSDLPPARIDEATKSLEVTLRVAKGKPRRVRIAPGRRGFASIGVLGSVRVSDRARAEIARGTARVLGLDQDLSGFYAAAAVDPDLEWAARGAGRMLRSPSVFEDVVKTICTTNCSWSLTTTMVRALVSNLGDAAAGYEAEPLANAFPTPAAMASASEAFYRDVVRAGYRARYFKELSRRVAEGEIDLEQLAGASRDELSDRELDGLLRALPGVGPYAAAHIMMTLGRSSLLILDSWTRPTYARLRGLKKVPSDRSIERRFRRYGNDAGLAFWLYLTESWA